MRIPLAFSRALAACSCASKNEVTLSLTRLSLIVVGDLGDFWGLVVSLINCLDSFTKRSN
ncbi:hypothetical protein D3C75_712790 [compost metagenome]